MSHCQTWWGQRPQQELASHTEARSHHQAPAAPGAEMGLQDMQLGLPQAPSLQRLMCVYVCVCVHARTQGRRSQECLSVQT